MNEIWAVTTTLLRSRPGTGDQIFTVPPFTLMSVTGRHETVTLKKIETRWLEVEYKNTTCWVYEGLVEQYIDPNINGRSVVIPEEIHMKYRPAQYITWEGIRHYNLCGPLCCAYIGNDSLPNLLAKWKKNHLTHYNTIMPKDATTGLYDLDVILKVYGHKSPNKRMLDVLKDPYTQLPVLTPERLRSKLETYYLIAGVKISKITGDLESQGINHWVVVEDVVPFGINNGTVMLYNPFENRPERYGFKEFSRSLGASGLFVPRNNSN